MFPLQVAIPISITLKNDRLSRVRSRVGPRNARITHLGDT